MKFVVRIDLNTLKYDAFQYDDPGPLPPVVDPEKPEEPKDGGVPGDIKDNCISQKELPRQKRELPFRRN
jgi:hypothetical protein